jgi:hypothetical protein
LNLALLLRIPISIIKHAYNSSLIKLSWNPTVKNRNTYPKEMARLYFFDLDTSHTISTTTRNTRKKAHHIPALNMVPIASQLLSSGREASKKR